MPSRKQIKLQSRYQQRTMMPDHFVPELRMSGSWLQKAGFAIGENVEIEILENQLIIKKAS